MRITTWNVNSVRLRKNTILKYIEEFSPDVLCFQETKVVDNEFPGSFFHEHGYEHQLFSGQKSYNGVAIIARKKFKALDTLDFSAKGMEKRHLQCQFENGLTLHNFYVPAGGDIPDPIINNKFADKITFLENMINHFSFNKKPQHVILGDFNIAPLEHDVWSHKALIKEVSHTPIEVELLTRLYNDGAWYDAIRHFVPENEKLYSWWSYRNRDWNASNRGRRLDHIWVSHDLKPLINSYIIAREARGWELPSDHVPVLLELKI